MPSPLSGPGVGLPLPQNLYPSELGAGLAPYDTGTNRVCIYPGEALQIPAGTWYIGLGMYLVLQYLDPVTGTWVMASGASLNRGVQYVKSDGFNMRIANLTGCPVSASVTAYGSGYVQASTTVTVTGGGGSTWLPIVGGQLGISGTFSLGVPNVGAGYGIAPIVFVPPPPSASNNSNGVGGIPASAYVQIASGTISAFSFTNPGAGYPSAPTPVVLPSPFDPNLSTGITNGSLAFSLTGSGSITAVLCTNNGTSLTTPSAITLTVNGVGSAATAVANVMQTVVAASVSTQGTGFGASNTIMMTTVGGVPNTGTIAQNPDKLLLAWLPRPAQVGLTTNAGGTLTTQVGTIYDGGLFQGTPLPVLTVAINTGPGGTVGTLALTMGSVPDIAILQPAP